MPLNRHQDARQIADMSVWQLAQPELTRLSGFASITTLGLSWYVRTSRAEQPCETQCWGAERSEQPCLDTTIVSQARGKILTLGWLVFLPHCF